MFIQLIGCRWQKMNAQDTHSPAFLAWPMRGFLASVSYPKSLQVENDSHSKNPLVLQVNPKHLQCLLHCILVVIVNEFT